MVRMRKTKTNKTQTQRKYHVKDTHIDARINSNDDDEDDETNPQVVGYAQLLMKRTQMQE